VKVYFDTAVVVAACVAGHPHYHRAVEALRSVHAKKTEGFISAHGLAECFSVLTRTPFIPPIFPNDAWQFLADNILHAFEIVTLSANEYQDAIQRCSQIGWAGGRVYDVLHLDSARKAACDRIYTFNVRHFQQLAPELRGLIGSP
jgi:predicted nucleic acid-binding protein